MTSPDGAAARPSPAPTTHRPSGRDLARFWDLSPAMMGVGDFDGCFTLVNPAYQEVLGRRVEDLQCVPYWEFVHPADRHAMVESGQRLLDGTGPHPVRVRGARAVPRRDVPLDPMEHPHGSPPGEGRPDRLQGIAVDVTDLPPGSEARGRRL